MTLIIDCHGHYTVLPKGHDAWREEQKAAFKAGMFARGEFELIFPTVRSLEALGRFDTAEQIVRHASEIAHIEPILPTIVDGDHGLRIVLPGDGSYDALTSKRLD